MTWPRATMRPAMQSLLSLATAPARRPLWRGLLALLLVVITWLALSPVPPSTVDTGWDKLNHLLAFAALAFVCVWALWRQPRQWLLLSAVLLAYGGAIEIAQGLLPPRQPDGLDMLADGVGVLLGLVAAWWVARLARPAA